MKSKLEEAFEKLKLDVAEAGLYWIDPNQEHDDMYYWYTQSNNTGPVSFMLTVGDDLTLTSSISIDLSPYDYSKDHFDLYKQYLKLIGYDKFKT